MTWRPIKSAPRDGTAFLAYQEGIEPPTMAVCYISIDRTLCYAATTDIVDEGEFEPTHWMPLPDPP